MRRNNWSWRLVIVLCMAFLLSGSISLATPAPRVEFTDVLIGFHDTVRTDLLTGMGAEVTAVYNYMPTVAARIPVTAMNALENHPLIRFVEPDGVATVAQQSVPWGVNRIEAILVHQELDITGLGVKVAVLDTGIDGNHRDLTVVGGVSYDPNKTSWADDHGHGTHVAGTIAALDNTVDVIGVAPDADLYAVKVLNSSGSGQYSWIISGIEWCIANGIQVINMSLGGSSGSQALEDVCQAAWDAGIVIVAAAGNSGNSGGTGDNVGYPARYPTVIAVASTDDTDVRSSFSSTGPAVEISAPGRNIPSTRMGGGTTSMSGTSMAAPHVAGVAALILQARSDWTNAAVRDQMNYTAEPIGDQDPYKYGHGLVNAYAAVPDPDYEPDPSRTRVSVSTDANLYVHGDTVTVTVDVKDGLRDPLPGADVALTVDVPVGQPLTFAGTTGQDGTAIFTFTAAAAYGEGAYEIEATASKIGYDTVSATTSCTVLSSLALDVTVWTDRAQYGIYSAVMIYALVQDPLGAPVGGANVHFRVDTPSGTVLSSNRTTMSNGEAMWWIVTWPQYGYGTYYVTATASAAGWEPATDTTTFIVQ